MKKESNKVEGKIVADWWEKNFSQWTTTNLASSRESGRIKKKEKKAGSTHLQ